MNKTLYCFISYREKIYEDYITISSMMKNINYDKYIIVYGGKQEDIPENKVVYLDCKDSYCDLPEKINTLFKYVYKKYEQFTHFVKVDRTVKIKSFFVGEENLPDYGGHVLKSKPNNPKFGQYHFNRCLPDSIWYEKEFKAIDLDYCSGIYYILSQNSVYHIANDNTIYKNNIYEDYYVGQIMKKSNIVPQHLYIREYCYDKDHPTFFK